MAETVIMPDGSGMGLGSGNGLWGVLLGSLLSNGGFWGGNRGMGGAGATAAATDVVLSPAFQSLENQISNLSKGIDTNTLLAGITSVNQNISGTSRDQLSAVADLSTAVAAGNFTTLNSINGLGRDITAAQTQALINNLQNFNALTGVVTTGQNQIISNLADMSARQQMCCCELKQAIHEDGNATRALINDTNTQNLRDQLAACQVKVSNNEQNQYLLTQILSHIHPVVS